ncbi:MAG: bifunctional chorismate mutase/prephenate dehydrogenase [Desulfobacterales bacterium]|jgi:chorismate mutase/prephenate dehydrogenase|nr:bifunctional chorismate mutase/prephenate dehydrogenase [Desulfobacterales bacterium]
MPDDSNQYQKDLDRMRSQIDAIDQQVVALLSKRQDQVNRVVALKKAHHLPVYHPAREEDLISARRQQAKAAGLDPDYVEEVFRIMLRQSRVEQSGQMARAGVRAGGTVLIVGGTGEMGRYFEKWFSGAGYEVRLMGRKQWPDIERHCSGVDLVMISVPIDVTPDIIRKVTPYIPQNAVLADITSIKKIPLDAMLEAHPGPVLGLHPLFGPTPASLDKQIVVATPGRDPEACQWVLDQFAAWGSVIVTSTPEEHDEIMAIVQALRHFATFSFGRFLAGKNVALSRTLEFSSPIYRLELGMVGRLFAQDAALYAEIIFASPERRRLLKDYVASLNENLAMLETGDKENFISEFKTIAQWFGPFGEQAMRESSFLIDKLIERF